jgi:hypothetical protein
MRRNGVTGEARPVDGEYRQSTPSKQHSCRGTRHAGADHDDVEHAQ